MKNLEQALENAKTYNEKIEIFRRAELKSYNIGATIGFFSSIPTNIAFYIEMMNTQFQSTGAAFGGLMTLAFGIPLISAFSTIFGCIGSMTYNYFRYVKKHPKLYKDTLNKKGGLLF